MAKTKPFAAIAATLMLAGSLCACGSAPTSAASASFDGGVASSAAPADASQKTHTSLSLGALAELVQQPAVTAAGSASSYASLEEIARALEDGSADIALVGELQTSALYAELGGRALVVDACQGEDGSLVCSVVSLATFQSRPEEVVSYVKEHGAACEGSGLTFFRGLAMQDELSGRIKSAYAQDPASVGGAMPPDNFYFLG